MTTHPPPPPPAPPRRTNYLVYGLVCLIIGLGIVIAIILVSGGGDESSGTTVSASATSTTAPPITTAVTTTTVAATTTTVAETTTAPTTTAPTTTTTSAPPPAFEFRPDGITTVGTFGDDDDAVVEAMTAMFGAPTSDTGWIVEHLCPGPLNRFVDYGAERFDLQVIFTTGDLFAPGGTEQFYTYIYAGVTEVPVFPPMLTVGTTVAQLQALHPGVVFQENPFLNGVMNYFVDAPGNSQLYGQLTGVGPADLVTTVQGGIGCAE